MKIRSVNIFLSFLIFSFLCFPKLNVYAEIRNDEEIHDFENNLKKRISRILPNSKDFNTEELDLKESKNYSISNFFNLLKNNILNYFKEPFNIFIKIISVILIIVIFSGFKDSYLNASLNNIISFISSVYITTIICDPIIANIVNVKEIIYSTNNFIISFLPIFGSLLTASAKPVSSLVYSGTLFSLSQFISFLIGNFLTPFLSIFLAFSITSSISNRFNISKIIEGIKKLIMMTLGILTTIFVSLISIQGLISNASDNLALKTGKFLVGNFVPIIGGTLSDAVSSVYGYVNVLKNGVGAFSIFFIIINFMPIIVKLSLMYLFLFLSSLISEIFSMDNITKLLKSILSTLSIILAIIFFFIVLMLITFTLIMVIGG